MRTQVTQLIHLAVANGRTKHGHLDLTADEAKAIADQMAADAARGPLDRFELEAVMRLYENSAQVDAADLAPGTIVATGDALETLAAALKEFGGQVYAP
jgi:hypothetical protein